jgi:hypothetical protein
VNQPCQAVNAVLGPDDHISPAATIASVRAASRDVAFATETHAAVTPIAGNDLDFDAIDKHG